MNNTIEKISLSVHNNNERAIGLYKKMGFEIEGTGKQDLKHGDNQHADPIIFDLDGTLWDASPASAIAWSKVANQFGINVSIDEAAIKKVSGLPFHVCFWTVKQVEDVATLQLHN